MKFRKKLGALIHDDIIYLLLNYFIAYIPSWTIRKFFYVLLGMKIGCNSRIAMRCIILNPKGINIGNNTIVNEFVLLDGRSKLVIGNNNSISMYSKLYTGTHLCNSDFFEYYGNPTIIYDNCWIGTAAIIMPGSVLRDFSVVSVNSVFKGESIDKGIYIGNPAALVKYREVNVKYTIEYHASFR